MKTQLFTGADIKQDNGSGYALSAAFPTRRFHNATIYAVLFNGVSPDCSNVTDIKRSRKGWDA
jgi:hypothetical protein